MKTKILLLSLFALVLNATAFAQNPAASAGIPVQGIARDDNNTARISEDITLTFELYYLISGTEFPIISPLAVPLTTDAFGVFSYTLNPGGDKSYLMANNQTYLRISEGATVISNEILNHVPYAISANNGVPTGSIMPYMGTTAPPGWLLCNGAAIPAGADFQPLRDVLGGTNTPDLGGMFLRGVGSNGFTTQNTTLGGVQDDTFLSHAHNVNLNTNTTGNHSHNYQDFYTQATTNLGLTGSGTSATNSFVNRSATTAAAGNHSHNVNGNTATVGGNETRPVNYGVNYIIKL